MIKVDIYPNYCRIYFNNLSEDTIKIIMAIVKHSELRYQIFNSCVEVYDATYKLLYEISVLSYILLM